MNTAFVTFVYPAAKAYFNRFLNSLNAQVDKEFTLVVFNDGCDEQELDGFFQINDFKIEIVENNCDSISENRFRAFDYLANSRYSHFIFGDIDDIFSENRVELSKKALINHEIIFNDLTVVDKNLNVICSNLVTHYLNEKKVITFEMVKNKNLIGFSHLAVTKKVMNFMANNRIKKDITIVDWAIIMKLLSVWDAYYVQKITTYYVMHENNIGLQPTYGYSEFLKEITIKMNQYKENQNLDEDLKSEFISLKELQALIEENIVTNENWSSFVINKRNDYYPWWNKLKYGKELRDEIQIRRNQKF